MRFNELVLVLVLIGLRGCETARPVEREASALLVDAEPQVEASEPEWLKEAQEQNGCRPDSPADSDCSIRHPHERIAGTIPPSIGNLVKLQEIQLKSNQLTGTVPVTIGNLTWLYSIDLDANQLEGAIPSIVGNLEKLQFLFLYANQLTGSIPATIGNLTNLKYLDLHANHLTGSIPATIGNHTALGRLDLHSNQLTGSIPATIGHLMGLDWLDLHANHLTGSIPATIGLLEMLHVLDLHANHLTGSIPTTIGLLEMLHVLDLHANHLRGAIPESIGNRRCFLITFDLHANQLTGTIPASIGNCHMRKLDVDSNQLEGAVPAIGSLDLEWLALRSNKLNGTVSLGNMMSLQTLLLDQNRFSGVKIKGDLPRIKHVNVSNNELTFLDSKLYNTPMKLPLDIRGNSRLQMEPDLLSRGAGLLRQENLLEVGPNHTYECFDIIVEKLPWSRILFNPETFAPDILCRCLPGHSGRGKSGAGVNCTPCQPGRFSKQVVAPGTDLHCDSCPEGTYSNKTTATECMVCEAGRQGATNGGQGATNCTACRKGWLESGDVCSKCADKVGTSAACKGCKNDDLLLSIFHCTSANESVHTAELQQGYWRGDGHVYACAGLLRLPEERQQAEFGAHNGWAAPPGWSEVARQACQGTQNGQNECLSGYGGKYCLECDLNYFQRGASCVQCRADGRQNALVTTAVGLVLATLALVCMQRSLTNAVKGIRSPPKMSAPMTQLWFPLCMAWLKAMQLCVLAGGLQEKASLQEPRPAGGVAATDSASMLQSWRPTWLLLDLSTVTDTLHLDCFLGYRSSRLMHLYLGAGWPFVVIFTGATVVGILINLIESPPGYGAAMMTISLTVLDITFIGTVKKVVSNITCIGASAPEAPDGLLLTAPWLQCRDPKATVAQAWNWAMGTMMVLVVLLVRFILSIYYRSLLLQLPPSQRQVRQAASVSKVDNGSVLVTIPTQETLSEDGHMVGNVQKVEREQEAIQPSMAAGFAAAVYVTALQRLAESGCQDPSDHVSWDLQSQEDGAAPDAIDANVTHTILIEGFVGDSGMEMMLKDPAIDECAEALQLAALNERWRELGIHPLTAGCNFHALSLTSLMLPQMLQLQSAGLVCASASSNPRPAIFILLTAATALALATLPHTMPATSVCLAIAMGVACLAAVRGSLLGMLIGNLFYLFVLAVFLMGSTRSQLSGLLSYRLALGQRHLKWHLTPRARRLTHILPRSTKGTEMPPEHDGSASGDGVELQAGQEVIPIRWIRHAVLVEIIKDKSEHTVQQLWIPNGALKWTLREWMASMWK